MFGLGKSEPMLTVSARKISDAVGLLNGPQKEAAKKTIAGIFTAVGGLGKLPDTISSEITSIVSKLLVKGMFGDGPTIWKEIDAGLSQELRELINKNKAI